MQLSELATYAKSKYNISEDHKWPDLPGISALSNPKTGKIIAVLMRQWDSDSGSEIQRCDIKCGQFNMYKYRLPYLSAPFRMTGSQWLGISFDSRTSPQLVYKLFEHAILSDNKQNYHASDDLQNQINIVIESTKPVTDSPYKDTRIPLPPPSTPQPKPNIPPQILEMKKLYKEGNDSFFYKCLNFYTQGMFMKDYTDNMPYYGNFRHYFPTYHDLDDELLRGYFTWRTQVRNGEYKPVSLSLAYMYLYELLNLIGADSPADSLQKLMAFKTGFLDPGYGDPRMHTLLQKWMFEFAVIHNQPIDIICQLADHHIMDEDNALFILRDPVNQSDEAVFAALSYFYSGNLHSSSVIKKKPEDGKHLFAQIWRYVLSQFEFRKKDLFTTCFGTIIQTKWNPLGNAVYLEQPSNSHISIRLNPVHRFYQNNIGWMEECYIRIYYNTYYLNALLHESDRRLRLYLKTGSPLKPKDDESWCTPFIDAVLQADTQARIEAARPHVHIDFSGLEQIRKDAVVTRDSLLTDAEIDETTDTSHNAVPIVHALPSAGFEDSNETPDVSTANPSPALSFNLDEIHLQILKMLLNNESATSYISAHHLMFTIVAETINEALFDEIGDNIIECDDKVMSVIDDYRDDVKKLINGSYKTE